MLYAMFISLFVCKFENFNYINVAFRGYKLTVWKLVAYKSFKNFFNFIALQFYFATIAYHVELNAESKPLGIWITKRLEAKTRSVVNFSWILN